MTLPGDIKRQTIDMKSKFGMQKVSNDLSCVQKV